MIPLRVRQDRARDIHLHLDNAAREVRRLQDHPDASAKSWEILNRILGDLEAVRGQPPNSGELVMGELTPYLFSGIVGP